MENPTFTTIVPGVEDQSFPNFPEAFRCFWASVMLLLNTGNTARQTLETACWIEGHFENCVGRMTFIPAKEIAYDLGILIGNGDLREPLPEVNTFDIEFAFVQCMNETASAMLASAVRLAAVEGEDVSG